VTKESLDAGLPTRVKKGLDRFCQQLKGVLGDKVISVVLYGGLAEGEYSEDASDVNVMVVLADVSVETLDRLANPVQMAIHDFRLSVLILSEEELVSSTDVFPIKFLYMQRRHVNLYGRDVLSDLSISHDHLRLRCEQELKNLMIRLHRFYVQRSRYSEQVENTLRRVVSSYIRPLGVLVELQTGEVPRDRNEIIAGGGKLGLDVEPVVKLLALKRGEISPDAAELKSLYEGFMQSVHAAAKLVDSL